MPEFAHRTGVIFNGANGGACIDPSNSSVIDPAIGYLASDSSARFVLAGFGARATAGRNNITTPGFGVLNFSVFKNTHVTESKYFQVRAEFFNLLNHRNFTISNGNIFSTAGITTATGNPAYALAAVGSPFLDAKVFNGGSRTITLGLKFIF